MADRRLSVLIVDDEKIDRDAYRLMIARCMPALKVVGEAQNGMEAVRFCCEYKPDIVLMDIQMPNLNGMETIRLLRAEGLNLNFVIISAYDYFEYAKEALDLGVLGFLVKPVSEEELVREMENICAIVFERKKRLMTQLDTLKCTLPSFSRKDILENLYYAIRSNASGAVRTFGELSGCKIGRGILAVLRIEGNVPDSFAPWLQRRGMHIQEILWQEGSLMVLMLDEAEANVLTEAFRRLCSEAQLRFQGKLYFYAGENYASAREMGRSLSQAVTLMGTRQSICIFDPVIDAERKYPYPYDRELNLLDAIQHKDVQRCVDTLMGIILEVEIWAEGDFDLSKLVLYDLFLALNRQEPHANQDVASMLDRGHYAAIRDIDALHEYFLHCVRCLVGYVDAEENGMEKIRPILDYIRCNYNRDISLSSVANRFFFSQGHLSRIIRDTLGLSYTEYVTQLRIERAIKLLRNTNEPISEIGTAVGYKDANYFSKVFKKATGQTPQSFRQTGL